MGVTYVENKTLTQQRLVGVGELSGTPTPEVRCGHHLFERVSHTASLFDGV